MLIEVKEWSLAVYILLFFSMSTGTVKRLFVGNVPFRIEGDELRAMFEEIAPVADFFWPMDRETGRKKGFLFVDVDEADVEKVRPGQTVWFTTLGATGRRHYARIERIEPAPDSISSEGANTAGTSSGAGASTMERCGQRAR